MPSGGSSPTPSAPPSGVGSLRAARSRPRTIEAVAAVLARSTAPTAGQAQELSPLAAALEQVRRLQAATAADPLAAFRGTPPQLALWRAQGTRLLLRTGNQVGGKTTAACVEALWWATHRHPYRRTPAHPVSILFVCVTWQQSLAIQKKLWDLCPKGALKPGQDFDASNGFGRASPTLEFADGSTIAIRTENQGAKNLAGSTLHLVIYDEPPKARRIYAELERRTARTGGTLILTMTPVNARIDWLREMAESGGILDLHFRCEPENLRLEDGTVLTVPDPATGLPRPMDAAWIAEQRRSVASFEEPVIIDGEWEMRAAGQVFEAWDRGRMASAGLLGGPLGPAAHVAAAKAAGQSPGEVRLQLGIDWADAALRTAAILVAVLPSPDEEGDRVWVLGEYVPDRATTIEQDAEGILALLAGLGLRWSDLDCAYGDKRLTDAAGKSTVKSNGMLSGAIARRLGQSVISPPVRGAKKVRGAARLGRQGALWPSVRWIHALMMRGHFFCDSACERLIESIETWDGHERHAGKDAIDGLRYALVEQWAATRREKALAAAPRLW